MEPRVIVVDDGSSDGTAERAGGAGAQVIRHPKNRGKGAALWTGLQAASEVGAEAMVSVDADGQHPASEAARLANAQVPATALVLGVRDLDRDGAPRASRFSNRFSNRFVSWFSGQRIYDTQCGLRRYPVHGTLELGVRATGFDFEAEALVRAGRAGWQIVQVPVRVVYPPPEIRVSHFRVVRDPARIVFRLLQTVATTSGSK
jgi:glycosyltransferase involved in cell wall biosynthesis